MAKVTIDTEDIICAVDYASGTDEAVVVVAVHQDGVLQILATSQIYSEREDYERLLAELRAKFRRAEELAEQRKEMEDG